MSDDFDSTWIDSFADAQNLGRLTPEAAAALLDLAGEAAHGSGDRRNAPLACFFAGLGLGLTEGAVDVDSVKRFMP
ncbi:MAG: hypothetical protein IT198_05880 [Acidimicrobiia bacterium]|nr:hypothetical protein [Acidimicrobiia bacterium]